jgi:hypothetical protein
VIQIPKRPQNVMTKVFALMNSAGYKKSLNPPHIQLGLVRDIKTLFAERNNPEKFKTILKNEEGKNPKKRSW